MANPRSAGPHPPSLSVFIPPHHRVTERFPPAVSIGPNVGRQTAIERHQIRGYLRRSVATMQGGEGRKGKKNTKCNSRLS